VSKRIIKVVDYDANWQVEFNQQKLLLKDAMGANALIIEHIGSTSILGLAAKPIIDILIEVNCLEVLDKHSQLIENLGFVALGENGIAGRRYFQKGENQRTHHIHVFKSADEHLFQHRVFRDYLIAHPVIADEYGVLKKQAARKCNNEALEYMNLKNDFISHHLSLAVGWFKYLKA